MKKKDIFNGNIKAVGLTKFTLIFVSVIFVIFGVFLICVASFYEKVDPTAIVLLYVFGGVAIFFAVALPIASLLLIRVYPKYSKLTFLLLKRELFYTPEELKQLKIETTNDDLAVADEPSVATRK